MESQEVEFIYNFELRGERQVERGTESMMEKMLRANDGAQILGAGLEKLGKIFEVGLPLGLAAAGVGLLIDKFSEAEEETSKMHEEMEKISEVDFHNASIEDLKDNLKEAKKDVDDLNKSSSMSDGWKSLVGFVSGSGGNIGEQAQYALQKATYDSAQKQAESIDFDTRQSFLEASGQGSAAKIEKLKRENADKIRALETAEGAIVSTPIYKKLPGGWDSNQIAGYSQKNLNQSEIDAIKRNEAQQVAGIHYEEFSKGNDKTIPVGDKMGKEARKKAKEEEDSRLKGFLRDMGRDVEDQAHVTSKYDESKRQAQSKVNRESERVKELSGHDDELSKSERWEKPVTTRQHEVGGGGLAYGGGKVNEHAKEIQKNNSLIDALNHNIESLIKKFGITAATPTL